MKIKKIITLVACVCLLSIFLAIPAFAVVTESSGDGYALYNGYKLPDIDSIWTDKAAYPYATTEWYDEGLGYCYISDAVQVANSSGNIYFSNGTYYLCYVYVTNPEFVDIMAAEGVQVTLGVWSFVYSDTANTEVYMSSPMWTSHNILYENGSTYLAASTPISLDGYNLIEWDGNITGLTVADNNYFILTHEYFPAVDAFTVMDLSYSNNPVVINGFTPINDVGVNGWFVSPPSSSFVNSACSLTENGEMWTVALKFDDIDDTGYTKMIAYRSVETPPDEGGGEDDDPHPPCGG